ncbi:SDR family NAD(P)-dependent oxidoreductase [Puia sp. P3]|uniref:SDR family NAD(P)-dependent oxidoreductase n=1 Tax=Puia sp. P3 TaxID=3423952 RepID=UPI003D679248
MKNTFTGKRALILGGSSGMGKATAQLLLSNGVKVVIASKSSDSVSNAVAELKAYGDVSGLNVDLRSVQQVDEFIKKLGDLPTFNYLRQRFRRLRTEGLCRFDPGRLRGFLDINRGFFFITQAVVRGMGSGSTPLPPA